MSRTSALALLAGLGVAVLGPVGGDPAERSRAVGPRPAQSDPDMSPSTGTAASPSPGTAASPPTATGAAGTILLGGPFGNVPGEPPESSGPGAGEGAPVLDAFVRSAPLRLEVGRPPETIIEWLVDASGPEGGRITTLASSALGDAPTASLRFQGPALPGRYRISAMVRDAAGHEREATWTIQVPDRPAPEDGLLEVPAPALTLVSEAGSITGWPGSGCYIYLCVEVGRLPPLRTLERLSVRTGEPLRLYLTDGSGMATWEATYLPIMGGLQPATSSLSGAPTKPVTQLTLEAPAAGDWLLMVEIGYDRERGWAQVFFRLTAMEAAPAAPD